MAAGVEEWTNRSSLNRQRITSPIYPDCISSSSSISKSIYTSLSHFIISNKNFYFLYSFCASFFYIFNSILSIPPLSIPFSLSWSKLSSNYSSASSISSISSILFYNDNAKNDHNSIKTIPATLGDEKSKARCHHGNRSVVVTTPKRIFVMPWMMMILLVWFGNLHQVSSHRIENQRCIRLKEGNLEEPPERYVYRKQPQSQLDLTLDTSQRLSHRISTQVVKTFLEEALGYQDVIINHYEEDEFNTLTAFDRIRSPAMVPESMINVEVWYPTTSMDNDIPLEYEAGTHASGSRFGWYVYNNRNDNVIDGQIIDHWRSFLNENVTKLFTLSPKEMEMLKENYTKDQTTGEYYCPNDICRNGTGGIFTPKACVGQDYCAILFVGNYSNLNSFLPQQIEMEEMLVQIAWIGPNFTPEFFCTFLDTKPALIFDWYPNQLSSMEKFLPISFPPCNGYEVYKTTSFYCNYELHSMKKLIWPRLADTDEIAVEAVKRFNLKEEDYVELLKQYDARVSSCGISNTSQETTQEIIADITCEWLQTAKRGENEVWRNWLPHNHEAKTVLWIGGIFSVTLEDDDIFSTNNLFTAAIMAINRINANSSILNDYEIKLFIQDGSCKSEQVLAAFISYIRKRDFHHMIGVLGPACSDTVEPLAGVARHFETVVLSYSAEGAIFNEHEKYPYFFRTIPENKMFGSVYLELFKLFGWNQVASFAEDCMRYSEYLTVLGDMLPDDINLEHFRFTKASTKNMTDLSDHIEKVKARTYKIIIGDFYASNTRKVMCEAYLQNMTAQNNYVWFLPRWFAPSWYRVKGSDAIACNNSMMLKALDRHMSLGYAYYAEQNEIYHEGISVADWEKLYENESNGTEIPDYAGYVYDAVWTYAFALEKLFKKNKTHVANLHSNTTNREFVRLIRETNFNGVSGNIQFKSGPSRESVINIMQFIVDENTEHGSYKIVGKFHPPGNGSNTGRLELNKDDLEFFNGIPKDGIVEDDCLFQTFSKLLGVSCDVTIVIVMVLIFSVFAIILFALFIIYKKRFEKMIPDPHWPLGELMSLDEWELPREKVIINRTIGEGAFGTVYGGECQFGENSPWLAVAVKTLKVGSTMEERLDFLGEAEMMTRLNHKNIVQLLGLCTHQEPIYMVMEFLLYGDLKIYLLARRHLVIDKTMQNDDDEVSSKRLTSMALDVSNALVYLSEHRYVHRDVACRNCLVSAERVVKLSDFGMTRPIYDCDYYRFNRRAMLPVRWMSPESLEDGVFTNMSDMWSYGVLLYEIITFGSFPFQNMKNNEVLDEVSKGNTISIPNGVKPQLKRLLQSCWKRNPLERPTFPEMVETLTMWPRLITPCLEVPTAAIQIYDTDSLDIHSLSPEVAPVPITSARRSSGPNLGVSNNTRVRNSSGNDAPNGNVVQLNNLSSPSSSCQPNPHISPLPNSLNLSNTVNSSGWNYTPQENGNKLSTEPLLPQNGDGYITSYVRLQHPKQKENCMHFDSQNAITAV